MKILLGIIVSYILGSFPSAYIVTKLKTGKDIREIGTKNMGTGNVFHTVGVKEGLLVLFLDAGKGVLSTYISMKVLKLAPYLALSTSFFAVIGHVYPIFLGFKGGKGAATTLGVQLAFLYLYFDLKVFLIFFSIILAVYLLFIVMTKSQVISLFFLFPLYPILLYYFSRDLKVFLISTLFVVVVESFGFNTFKRDFTRLYSFRKKK
ncbi:MAG: glycerol-3-phosphate acyltransferase [Caldisericaceae bacterium]